MERITTAAGQLLHPRQEGRGTGLYAKIDAGGDGPLVAPVPGQA